MNDTPRLVAPERRAAPSRCRGLDPAAALSRRLRRAAAGARQSQGVHRQRQVARRGARPRAVLRPARPRQDDARADRGARIGRRLPLDLRPGDRQGRRPRRHPHQSRGARRSLHRRDPPAQPGGRGNPLSGDGGFPARSRHRRGAGGALGQDRPVEFHAGRRHHPRRPAHHAAARPLRHSDPPELLHAGGTRIRSCGAAPASWASASPTTAPTRSPRRSRGTPRIAGRLLRRVRDFAVVDRPSASTREFADAALRCSMSTRAGSIRWTGAICR